MNTLQLKNDLSYNHCNIKEKNRSLCLRQFFFLFPLKTWGQCRMSYDHNKCANTAKLCNRECVSMFTWGWNKPCVSLQRICSLFSQLSWCSLTFFLFLGYQDVSLFQFLQKSLLCCIVVLWYHISYSQLELMIKPYHFRQRAKPINIYYLLTVYELENSNKVSILTLLYFSRTSWFLWLFH